MKAIWKREIQNYFLTPIGYVFVGIFLLLSGFFFFTNNLNTRYMNSDLQSMFGSMSFLFMLAVPLLTMKLLSDERRTKTDQLLLTSPISVWSIVMGKFLAACSVLFLTLFCTLFYVVIISAYGTLYTGLLLSNYLGFFTMCCSFIAIGVLMSSLTESMFSAAMLTWGANLLLMLLEGARPMLANPYVPFLPDVVSWISLQERYYAFSSGVLSVANLVYYASFCGIMLFLTVRVIDKRRWSES